MNKVLFTSNKDDWETPQDFFEKINKIYHFTLDVASSDNNSKCKRHFTKKENGLLQNWDNDRVWCNPPYGKEIIKWVEKASESKNFVCMLLPARTDTKWFHEIVLKKASHIQFCKGRIRFVGAKNSAPFPSMLVYFND